MARTSISIDIDINITLVANVTDWVSDMMVYEYGKLVIWWCISVYGQ